MPKRVVGCVVAAAAAVALVPGAVFAAQPYSGSAITATLTVSVNPNALLTLPGSDIPASVSSLLGGTLPNLSAQVNASHATATRSGSAADLSAGHADVTPLALDVSSVSTLLGNIDSALQALWGQVSLTALQATQTALQTLTSDTTVMAQLSPSLASDLTTLEGQLSSLAAQLTALPNVLPAAIDQLEGLLANVTRGLTADLDSAHPDGQNSTAVAVTVPPSAPLPSLVQSAPEVANLTPFSATAVNAAGATQFGASGPQAAGTEGASSIDVAPVMDLTSLANDLVTLRSTLQQVQGSINTITPLLGPVSAIIALALPGGLDLTTLLVQVTSALGPVGDLVTMVQNIALNGAMVCNDLGTGACSLGSTSVTPRGAGIDATATSKVVQLQVLPMDQALAAAVNAAAGTPLLEVDGLQAGTDAYIDGSNGTQTATSSLTDLSIAGTQVVKNGQIQGAALSGSPCQPDASNLPSTLVPGEPMTFCIATPVGDVSAIVTLGQSQTTYTAGSHRSVSLTELEVRLLNGAPDGSSAPITTLGTTQAGTIATVDMGSVSSEVLGASLVPTSQGSSNVVMEQTGMFGPGSLLFGFGLLGGGALLRRVCSPARRREGQRGD